MFCQSCQHENPPNSNFCNQCGTRLEVPEEPREATTQSPPRAFAIPGSADGRSVAIADVLYPSTEAARAALAAVGAIPQPLLEHDFAVPGVGRVRRCFGVIGNNLDFEEATDAGTQLDVLAFAPNDLSRFHQVSTAITTRIDRVLYRPDNERVLGKMKSGKLKFTPSNRQLSRRLEGDVVEVGLHLPWSIGGIDVAFGQTCRQVLQGFGFVCYHGHLGRIEPVNGKAAFRRTRELISVPFGVDGYHTWDASISDDIVDEDLGILIEANCRI